MSNLVRYAENSGFSDQSTLSLLLIPTLIYLAVPIVNVDLNITISPLLKFNPNSTIQSIVPTVFRSVNEGAEKYGVLINEANNVSSFYISFISDYGVIGAFVAITIIQVVVCYVYARAGRGSLYSFFIWPALFMSTVLSFFSSFFTSLVVLMYPLLTLYFVRGLTSKSIKQLDLSIH